MPVRARSRSSMAARAARPLRLSSRSSSSSGWMPGRMAPPSAKVAGGESTTVAVMSWWRSCRTSIPSARVRQRGDSKTATAARRPGRQARVAARARTSRGPAESMATRPRRRSRSSRPSMARRTGSRRRRSAAASATASRRASISARARAGRRRVARRRRLPMGVRQVSRV